MRTEGGRGKASLGRIDMSEAAAQPAPDLPQTLEGLAALLGDLAAENRRLFEEAVRISRAPMSQDDRNVVIMLVHRAADVEGIERAILDKLNQEVRLRTVRELWEKTAPQPEPAPVPEPRRPRRRGGHRKGNPDQLPLPLYLRGLPSLVPVAAAAFRPVAAMVRHSGHTLRPAASALRNSPAHAWIADHAAQVTAGTAATVIGGGVLLASVVPPGPPAHAAGSPAARASVPGWNAAAVPVPVGTPGRIASAVTHPGKARTLTLLAPPTLPAYDPPAPDGGSQDPAPQLLPPSLPVPVPQVSLIVTGALDLDLRSSGVVRLTAFGGPVSWQATASAAGMDLDQESGVLSPGHSASIGVSIIADLQALTGPGSVTITYGGGKTAVVPVSWSVIPLPLPSLPDPVPSEVASILPGILGS